MLETIENIIKLAVNYGLPLVLVIYYIFFEIPKQRKHQIEMMEKLKKELNIDDLEKKIDTLILKNENLIEKIEMQSKEIELVREIMKSISEILITGKQFTNEEMYKFLKNQLFLSILRIRMDNCETVDENHLSENKDAIFAENRDKITARVYDGREFLYTLNFDTRLLDVVFENTEKLITLADKAIKKAFNEFFCISSENITVYDYRLLKRKIKGIANEIELETDKLLRKVILGVNN